MDEMDYHDVDPHSWKGMQEDALEREFRKEREQPNKNTRKAMSNIQVEVIGITGPEFVKTAKGGYNTLEVAYKSSGKVSGKKLVDFAGQEVFKTFKDAKNGDIFDVVSMKDKNDYWQWTKATRSSAESSEQEAEEVATSENSTDAGSETASSKRSNGSTGGRGKVTGSNYETPEERTLRREFDRFKHNEIRRQSCLNIAISTLSESDKATLSVDEITKLAEQFDVWVQKANA